MKIKYIIGPAAELVAVSIGFINFKSFDKKLLFIFCFACFGFCIDLGTNILVEVFGLRHTLIFLHFYIPIEFLLISSAYYLALKDFLQKRIILYLIIGFEIYCLINPIFFQHLNEYSNARAISSLLFILFSILYYNKVMVEAKIKSISQEPMIWINTAVLLYFSGNLFSNILFSIILETSRDFSKFTTYFIVWLTAAFYLLIAIAFWKAGKKVPGGQSR